MPTNLNALIRYKTIDKCLQNQQTKHDIKSLQEVCSEALGEYRGVYKKVGERTIRDDIRVMRSDILGFHAPIVYNDGYYSYSDPDYSIFNTSIEEKELLNQIYKLLLEEYKKIDHPDFLKVLEKLAEITENGIPSYIKAKITGEKRPAFKDKIAPIIDESVAEEFEYKEIPEEKHISRKRKEVFDERGTKLSAPKAIVGPYRGRLKTKITDYKRARGLAGLFGKKIELLLQPYSWQSIFNLLESRPTN